MRCSSNSEYDFKKRNRLLLAIERNFFKIDNIDIFNFALPSFAALMAYRPKRRSQTLIKKSTEIWRQNGTTQLLLMFLKLFFTDARTAIFTVILFFLSNIGVCWTFLFSIRLLPVSFHHILLSLVLPKAQQLQPARLTVVLQLTS